MDTHIPAAVLHIAVREWFEKVNGNTYQSVAVYLNGKRIGTAPCRYGRGDGQALHTAREVLRTGGWPVLPDDFYQAKQEGWGVSLDRVEVARRKDLHALDIKDRKTAVPAGHAVHLFADEVAEAAATFYADGMPLAQAFEAARHLEVAR